LTPEEIEAAFMVAGAGKDNAQKNVLYCRRPSEADIFNNCDYSPRTCAELTKECGRCK
jgi:hypothetical protein